MERYEEYKDSGVEWIGEIPRGWGAAAAKRWARISNGSNPTTNGNTPVYGSSGVAFKTCGESKQAPAVLLGRKGTIGSPSYIDHPYWNVDTAFDVKTDEEVLKLRYYFYLATCFDYARYQTNTTVPSMTQTDYEDMIIPLPSVIEQQAIAGYLDAKTVEIDALVADCERAVDLLREYRKAVISEAVTKGLNPDVPTKDSGIEWIGKIPVSWAIVPFKAIGTVAANLQHPSDYPDVPQVSPDRIEKDSGRLLPCVSVAEAGVESDNHLFHAGDILYSKVRPALNKVTVAPFDGMCSADMYPIVTAQNRNWLVCYMLSNAFMEQVIVSTDRVKMPKINKEELGTFKVVLSDADTQIKIAAYLDAKTAEINSLIDAKQSMVDKLREYRRSLISEAITGKFKVPGV